MDYKCKIFLVSSFHFLFIITIIPTSSSYGFDAASSCSPKISRRGRAELLATIPCDLTQQAYCNLPGSSYPWHAVRRFVHENQGLMKRMYGDVRHISILRDEIQNNDIDVEDIANTAARYSRDSFRKMKYLQADTQNVRTNEVYSEPHFRPTTTSSPPKSSTSETPASTTPKTTTTSETTTAKPTTKPTKTTRTTKSSTVTTTSTSSTTSASTVAPSASSNSEEEKLKASSTSDSTMLDSPDNNLESNNIIDVSTQNPNFSNIKVVQAPNLGFNEENKSKSNNVTRINVPKKTVNTNKTESATISTTLKVVQQIIKAEIESEKSAPKETDDKTSVADEDVSEEDQIDRIDEDVSIEEEDNTVIKNTTMQQVKPDTLEVAPAEGDAKSNERIFDKKKPGRPNTMEAQLFQDTLEKQTPPPPGVRGVNACPVKEEVVAPFWANNTRGEVLALLNLYPFEQYVHWEKCTHELKQMYCREGCRCEQQYRLHRLLAYDPHNECRGIFSDWFRFPSCCICKCYDIPPEFRVTSRSPRTSLNEDTKSEGEPNNRAAESNHIDAVEIEVQRAIYEHATENWYRPREEAHFFEFVDD